MDASDGKFVQSAVLESPVFNRIHSHKCKVSSTEAYNHVRILQKYIQAFCIILPQ